jgi:hypothetical protein
MAAVLGTERVTLIVRPGGWPCNLSSAYWPPMSGCERSFVTQRLTTLMGASPGSERGIPLYDERSGRGP